MDDTKIVLIPEQSYKKLDQKCHRMKFSWRVLKPVLIKLLKKGWGYKFENDGDRQQLQEIEEDAIDPIEKLDAIKTYFDDKYQWPYDISDPVLHTRIIITPSDSRTPINIYYGQTMSFQNNNVEDIKMLLASMWLEYSSILNKKHPENE